MKILRTTFALSMSIIVPLLACGGANPGPAVTGTPESGITEPQKGADMAVVNRLSEARCDQEQTCKNVGPGAKYASRSTCMEQIHGSIANDLNAYNCPRGLDSAGVDRCMAAIKGEECNHPFDTLTRYDTCRTGALCMR